MGHRRPLTGLVIVHEDEHVVVVDKPAGLLTIATERERERTAYALLYEHVKRARPPGKIFIVHRLDRDASGLVVFAKSVAAKRALQQQFHDHAAGRRYLALVEGRVSATLRTIRSHLGESIARKSHSVRDPARGRLAVTHLRIARRFARTTLLEVQLETGRKHQIRAHLAERGHPIVGDRRYGARATKTHRLALHATRLAFVHPATGAALAFDSPPPAAFANLR
jgi:23S rRNA pseudouridine1911/1915/1917 synthase